MKEYWVYRFMVFVSILLLIQTILFVIAYYKGIGLIGIAEMEMFKAKQLWYELCFR